MLLNPLPWECIDGLMGLTSPFILTLACLPSSYLNCYLYPPFTNLPPFLPLSPFLLPPSPSLPPPPSLPPSGRLPPPPSQSSLAGDYPSVS